MHALRLDEPRTPRYMTLWGSSDTTVPQSATNLDGGACYTTIDGVVHTAYEEDEHAFDAVVLAINGGDGWCRDLQELAAGTDLQAGRALKARRSR
jgi:hypothetical protein